MQRAPGESTGTFALECALDELAWSVGVDPLELPLRNYAENDPSSGKPWSSKSFVKRIETHATGKRVRSLPIQLDDLS